MKESNNKVDVTEFKDGKSEVQQIGGGYTTLFSNVDWMNPNGFFEGSFTLFDAGLTNKKIPNGHFILGSSTVDLGDRSQNGMCPSQCYSIVSNKEASLEDGEYEGPWGKKPGIHGFRITSSVDNLYHREKEIDEKTTKEAIYQEFLNSRKYAPRNVKGATNMIYADWMDQRSADRDAASQLDAARSNLNRNSAPFFIDKTVPYTFWDTEDGSQRVYRLAAEHDPYYKPRVARTKTISDGKGGEIIQREILQVVIPREPPKYSAAGPQPYGAVKTYSAIADWEITPLTNEWMMSLFDVRTESAAAKFKYENKVMNVLLYTGATLGVNKIKKYCKEYYDVIIGHNYLKLITGGLNKQDAKALLTSIDLKEVIGESTDRALQMAVAYCKDRGIDVTIEGRYGSYNRLTLQPTANPYNTPPRRPFEYDGGEVTNVQDTKPIHPRYVADLVISTNPSEEDQSWYTASYALHDTNVSLSGADEEAIKNILTGAVKPTSQAGIQFLSTQKENNPGLYEAIKTWIKHQNNIRAKNIINISKAMNSPYKYLGGQIHQMETKFVTNTRSYFTTSALMLNYFGFGSQSMITRPTIDIVEHSSTPKNWNDYDRINPKIQPIDLGGVSGPVGQRGIEQMIKSQNKVDLLNESATAYYVYGETAVNKTKTKVYIGNDYHLRWFNSKMGRIFSDDAQDKMMKQWANPAMFELFLGAPLTKLNTIASASRSELARMERAAWENSMMFKVQQACIAGLRKIQNIDIGWDSEPEREKLKNPLQNYINFANGKGLANKIRNPLNSGGGTMWKGRN